MNLAGFAVLKVADAGMMHVVILLHHFERRIGEWRQHMAGQFILLTGFKQGMMPAIMLQDVQAHSADRKDDPCRDHDIPLIDICDRKIQCREVHSKRPEKA